MKYKFNMKKLRCENCGIDVIYETDYEEKNPTCIFCGKKLIKKKKKENNKSWENQKCN